MSKDTPAPAEHGARLFLAVLGFVAVLAGQFAFYLTPEGRASGVWWALILTAVGTLTLIVGLQPGLAGRLARLRLSARAALVVLGLALAIMTAVTQVLFQEIGRTNYLPVLLLWLGAAVAYAGAFMPAGLSRAAVAAWARENRRQLVLLALVTLLGASLRLYRLGSVPRVIDGDEGRVGQAAQRTYELPLANPFALFENFGGVYIQAIGLSLETLGGTPFALRLVPALAGSLAIPALYLLGRGLVGPRVGLTAAALLAISHAHLHFSRIVSVAYIAETMLVPLELYFLYTGLRQRQAWRMAVGGVVLGAHFSVYVTAQVILALVIVYLLIALVVARPLVRGAGRLIVVFWLGVGVTALPQAVFAARNPNEFLARLNAEGTFQSGWLDREIESTGQGAVPILAKRVVHAFLTLNHLPAIDFYGARIPLLDLLTGTLFVVGLVYCLWRTRDSQYLLLNGYFWSLLVAIAIFAIPPTADSYRMLVALPAAMVLAAVGLEQLQRLLLLDGPNRRGTRVAMTGALLASALTLNARAYYMDFAARCRYGGDLPTRFASYMGNYLKNVDAETAVYLLSDDQLQHGTHPSADFLSDGVPVINWPDPADSLPVTANMVVLAGPDRHEELRQWSRRQPTGETTHQADCEQPMLLVYESEPAK